MDNQATTDSETKSGKETTRRLPAGVADAAFASLATFAAGLSAVTLFSDVDRGVYAMFFTAFGLGVVLPWNLILIPAEVNAVSLPLPDRMRRARATLKMGLRASITGTLAILVVALISRSLTDGDVIWGLSLTAAVATILSPLQDHIRRLLHVSELSWQAATVSVVQFLGVVTSLGVMLLLDAPVAVMPFGSLAFANAISLTTGLILGRVMQQRPLETPLRFWALAGEGRWLLAQAMIPSVAHFAVAAIITALAGAEILGYTEAARVVAQPVLVFATGLTAVLAPRSIKAAMERDKDAAARTRRIYLLLMTTGGVLYLVAAGHAWVWNPMQYLVPSAYIVSWLVAAKIIANITVGTMYLDVNELLGAQKAKPMAGIAIVTSPILVIVALTARATEAFSRPFGILLRGVVQIAWYRSTLRRHYGRSTKQRETRPHPAE